MYSSTPPLMIRIFSLFAVGILLAFPALSRAQAPGRNIDVQHYRFQLELNDSTDVIRGQSRVDFIFTEAEPGEVVLDLVDRQEKGGMKVLSVKAGEEDVPFRQSDEQLILEVGGLKSLELKMSLLITYEGIPADGLVISKNKYGDRTFFGDNWPNRAHHWLPVVDHPADKATCEFLVTAPEHYQVVANGALQELSSLPGGRRLTHWRSQVILPTKVMVIGVARFAVQQVGDYKGVPVSSWVYPQNREAGFYDYALAKPVLEFMEKKIGPYPYAKLANVQSTTRYGGMENASNIFYSENSITGKRDCERLIAHEIAHQWYGNSASEREWAHIWLSEGFATYFTHLYIEEKYGRKIMIQDLLRDRARVLTFHKLAPRPIVDTTVQDLNELLNPNSYQKGAWVLHMLRHVVGEEAFWKGIRVYYQRFRLGNALTADFQQTMEEVSGKKLDWFFQQWIFQAGHPKYQLSWEVKKGTLKLQVEQQQEALFSMPLDIAIYLKDNDMPRFETIELNDRSGSFEFPVEKEVEKVVLDPGQWVLKEVR
jgi:aminopeptidase N